MKRDTFTVTDAIGADGLPSTPNCLSRFDPFLPLARYRIWLLSKVMHLLSCIRLKIMRRLETCLAPAMLGIVIAVTVASPADAATSPRDDAVWDWDARCSSPKQIRIEVTLDGKRMYTTTFGICPASDYPQPMKPQRTLVFKIAGPHKSLFGEPRRETLEGNVWQAGRDTDGIVLGVSFAGPKRVWCNSLHVLDPNKASKTVLARGLIVKTTPHPT